MKYLVTGAAGFIGSHIVEHLAGAAEVVAIDNFVTGKRENIEPFLPDIEFVEGDVRDGKLCLKLMKGVDYVLHQAALGSVPRSMRYPMTTHENNVTGTLTLLEAARQAGHVRRFVLASSSSVYGDSDVPQKSETLRLEPVSPYAASKAACEVYCRAYWRSFGLPTVCLRYFNVYGPRQDPLGPYAAVVPRFITRALVGQPLPVYGDGGQTRDFTAIVDAVGANLLACCAPRAVEGRVFNVAGGLAVSVRRLAGIIWDAADTPAALRAIDQQPERPGDVLHSLADLSMARALLGYQPGTSIKAGIAATVASFQRELR